MSWSISHIGTRAAVREKILTDYIPATVRQLIIEVIDDPKTGLPNGIKVDGYGHQSDGSVHTHYSNIGKLEIQPINLDV